MKKIKLVTLFIVAIMVVWLGIRTEANFGRCLDNDGNGKVYNGESYYNYIKYDNNKVQENDIVFTIDLLNPLNNYCDDIIFRYDIVVLKNV